MFARVACFLLSTSKRRLIINIFNTTKSFGSEAGLRRFAGEVTRKVGYGQAFGLRLHGTSCRRKVAAYQVPSSGTPCPVRAEAVENGAAAIAKKGATETSLRWSTCRAARKTARRGVSAQGQAEAVAAAPAVGRAAKAYLRPTTPAEPDVPRTL